MTEWHPDLKTPQKRLNQGVVQIGQRTLIDLLNIESIEGMGSLIHPPDTGGFLYQSDARCLGRPDLLFVVNSTFRQALDNMQRYFHNFDLKAAKKSSFFGLRRHVVEFVYDVLNAEETAKVREMRTIDVKPYIHRVLRIHSVYRIVQIDTHHNHANATCGERHFRFSMPLTNHIMWGKPVRLEAKGEPWAMVKYRKDARRKNAKPGSWYQMRYLLLQELMDAHTTSFSFTPEERSLLINAVQSYR